MKTKIYQWINSVSLFISVILIFGVSQLSKYTYTNIFIPEKYDNLLTPSMFVNLMWLGLMVGLILFCAYQWEWFGKNESSRKMAVTASPFLGLACILNAVWVILLHNNMLYAGTAVCLFQIIMLIIVNRRMNLIKSNDGRTRNFSVLFDVFFAWMVFNFMLMFSSLLNVTWGVPSLTWSVVAILIISAVGAVMAKGHAGGTLALIWSLSGVFSKQMQNFVGDEKVVAVCSIIGIFIMGAAAVYFSSPTWLADYEIHCDNCTYDDVR